MIDELELLNYFPFGPKNFYSNFMGSQVDLRELYLYSNNSTYHMSNEVLILNILKEVGYAMNYVKNKQDEGCDWFNVQGEIANSLWQLLTIGNITWDKSLKNSKSISKIRKAVKINNDRYSRLNPNSLTVDYDDCELIERVEKYGILTVKNFPLATHCKLKIEPLYNKQELVAIYYMVTDQFHNMC